MKLLFDNDAYVVVHVVANAEQDGCVPNNALPDHCFEIVDKKTNKEVFLRGSWAAAFQRQINEWQAITPDETDVEIVLQGFCELAQIPLVIH